MTPPDPKEPTMPSDPVEELIARVGEYVTERTIVAPKFGYDIHWLHVGTEREATLTLPDLAALVTALVAAREEIDSYERITYALQPCGHFESYLFDHGEPDSGCVLCALEAAKEPTTKLTASNLRPYVRHSEGCSAGIDAKYPCKCGLSELMAKEESNGE